MDSRPAEIRISQEGGEPVRLTVDGVDVAVPDGADPAEVGLGLVTQEAQRSGKPVPALLVDESDVLDWRVLVHPDGSVSDDLAAGEPPPARRRLRIPAGRAVPIAVVVALVALVAVSWITRAPSGSILGFGAPAPTTAVAVPPPATTAAAPPTVAPAPTTVAAPPSVLAVPVPAGVAPTSAPPTRVVPPPTRAVPPTRPVPPAVVTRPPAAVPAPTLADAAGRCLTASGTGVTSAACSGSGAQAWTAGGGQLRNGGKCLAFGDGLSLAICGGAATQGWAAGATTTTNSGMCLEVVGTRPVLTQCGTGRPLVLRGP